MICEMPNVKTRPIRFAWARLPLVTRSIAGWSAKPARPKTTNTSGATASASRCSAVVRKSARKAPSIRYSPTAKSTIRITPKASDIPSDITIRTPPISSPSIVLCRKKLTARAR